jgi:hypothetical protein
MMRLCGCIVLNVPMQLNRFKVMHFQALRVSQADLIITYNDA